MNSASFAAAKKDRVPLAELAAKGADRASQRRLSRILAAREDRRPATVSAFNSAL
uniref:FXSXX-COOH protein n=1 Tax=Streptomyces sp. NBC_00003 TaxID=2903608 RepID=A0AAU2VBI0_9ACTN